MRLAQPRPSAAGDALCKSGALGRFHLFRHRMPDFHGDRQSLAERIAHPAAAAAPQHGDQRDRDGAARVERALVEFRRVDGARDDEVRGQRPKPVGSLLASFALIFGAAFFQRRFAWSRVFQPVEQASARPSCRVAP